MAEGVFKLFTDGSGEAARISELLKRAKVSFEIVKEKGKVGPELLIGDPAYLENWLTGFDAIKQWLKKRKMR